MSLSRRLLRIEETKTGKPLLLPVTRQLAAVLERRRADGPGERAAADPAGVRPSGLGVSLADQRLRPRGRALPPVRADFPGGGERSSGSTGSGTPSSASRSANSLLPRSLTKRLVNHARHTDVTEDYAADWTIRQLREPRATHRRPDRGADARGGSGGWRVRTGRRTPEGVVGRSVTGRGGGRPPGTAVRARGRSPELRGPPGHRPWRSFRLPETEPGVRKSSCLLTTGLGVAEAGPPVYGTVQLEQEKVGRI